MKIVLISLLLSCAAWAEPRSVLVGGYEFPPYVINKNGNVYEGLTLDLIKLLNEKQTKYSFRFVPTSASRRYHNLRDGRYQIIAFESKSWGWDPSAVNSTKSFQSGGEVFITLNDAKKTQSYFKDLKGKKIKAIHGFHYGFLGLSTGPKALKSFDIEFTNTHEGNILAVLNKRADIAVLPKEYLDIYLQKNAQNQKSFLVSKDFDQIYDLGILVGAEQKIIQVEELNKIIDSILKDGSWKELLKKKGLQ